MRRSRTLRELIEKREQAQHVTDMRDFVLFSVSELWQVTLRRRCWSGGAPDTQALAAPFVPALGC